MADSRIIGNVVQPLARSVVEPSTTGVDANNSINQLTDSGESTTNLLESNLLICLFDTDTDSAGTSRPGSISPTKMDSIKPKSTIRKTTFKSVSVNKVFLKDSVPTAGPVSNALGSTTSKASTAFSVPQPASRNVLSASKLKFVKTGASSQTSRPGSTGPAGSAGSKKGDQALPVWNKNLPTPPPPKKDVTDEELKLEFGIHLASRLVSDNESKEAKWADIDDDDDDWVPEAIAWNDGMKVTMDDTTAATTAANTETTVSPPATHIEPVCLEPVKEVAPPKSPVPVPVVPVAPMKEESRPKTLITEKPSSKPTETTSTHPVRASPWAKIPPPNAGLPIVSNHNLRNNDFPPPPPPRHELGVEPSAQHTTNSSFGMKEVSAEVFDRSWRDRPVNHSARERELFNSETGQLEPVREARNGGARQNRNDPPMHKHSVLQRPSGPAEPSAAFQQSRSSMSFHRPEDYGRRRASSNVSGGSGSTGGRRPSFSTGRFSSDQPPTPDDARFPGQDLRRGSFGYSNPFDNEGSRGNHTQSGPYSPKFQHPSPRMAVISPVMNHVRPSVTPNIQQIQPSAIPPAPVVDPNYEDPVIAQERIMKESSQLARKRRQEEEAKEEAAKQERLKIKLEALEKQAKLREEEAAKQKAIQDKREAEEKAAEELRLAEEKAVAEKKATDEKAAAEIKAQEALAKKESEERLASERERPRQGQFPDRSAREPAASFIRSRSPGNTSGIPTGPQMQGRRPAGHMQTQDRGSREQPPWKSVSSGSDRYTGQWGSSGSNGQAQNSTDGNPWAPVGEKPRFSGFNGVGNGTFENRYSGFSARSNASPAMHGQQNRDDGRQGGRPGRSGHISPGFSRGTRPNDNIPQDDRSQAVNRWNTLANTLQDDESTERRRNREERLAREADEAASGIKREPVVHPKISETWRKVEISDGQGQVDRKLVSISKIVRDEASSINKDSLTGPPAIIGTAAQSTTGNSQLQRNNIPTGPAAGRPTSRFFPAAANLVAQHLGNPSIPIDETTPKINPPGSPPPPMSSEHPVHGDINSRVVHLPPSPQAQHASGRISPSSRPNNNFHKMDNPKSPRHLPSCDQLELVQRRILESMGKSSLKQQSSQQQSARPHPQDNNVLASKDFSATKPSFEEIRGNINKPSVSLPGSSHGSKDSSEKGEASAAGEAQMDGGCILSKPDDEEFFHGLFERDFGSTPTVKIPHNHTPIYNGNPSKSPMSPLQKSRKTPRLWVQAPQTINAFDPFDPSGKEFVNVEGKRFIPVHLPGGKESEVLCKVPEGKHRKKFSGSRKSSGKFNGGNGGHMGRGSSMGKRVAELVQ
ncbi:hypothetical protein P167DRAFT_557763 [Morchella conica CCBAS932]|uniref:Uncharacterized protein n=1 Tax=Morchella conica CCBAS932 TaxID=1392247 RepID=A0A3N4KVF6_9PEZI|nr:hypothetical protein P167DRAFT_557763 [Morchella conica CCBAS932]